MRKLCGHLRRRINPRRTVGLHWTKRHHATCEGDIIGGVGVFSIGFCCIVGCSLLINWPWLLKLMNWLICPLTPKPWCCWCCCCNCIAFNCCCLTCCCCCCWFSGLAFIPAGPVSLLLLLFLLRNIFHSFLHSWLGMHGLYGVGYLTLLTFVIGNRLTLLWSLILIFLLSLFDERYNQRKIATQVLPYLLLKLEKFLIILAGGWA